MGKRYGGDAAGPPIANSPDGVSYEIFPKKEWEKMKREYAKKFNVKSMVIVLKEYAKYEIEK